MTIGGELRSTGNSGDGNEGCTITILNNTSFAAALTSQNANHGYFTQGPASNITQMSSTTVMAQGTDGTATGCEITFTYELADANNTTFTWSYEKPYDGENSFSVTSGGKGAPYYTITQNPSYSPSSDDWLTITVTIALATAPDSGS